MNTSKGKAVTAAVAADQAEQAEVAEASTLVAAESEVSLVAITSILLSFVNADVLVVGGKKPNRKKAYAMILWADGADITAVAHFKTTRFIMREYNAASDRGVLDCGCSLCTNTAKLPMSVHDAHVIWHQKYRAYFKLRQIKFPTLKDMDQTRTWTSSQQKQMLAELVELWKQVDGEAPWFLSSGYLTQQKAAMKIAAAQTVLAASAAQKAIKIVQRLAGGAT